MSKHSEGKRVCFSFKTRKEHLDSIGLDEESTKDLVKYFADLFGTRYLKLFPVALDSNDISKLHALKPFFAKVINCPGLKRLINLMDKNNFQHHLFTVRAAGWLLDLGYEVEFEPEVESESEAGVPDLLICREGLQISVECKDIDTDPFFDHESKKQIADFIHKMVQTSDQIDVYLMDYVELSEIEGLFDQQMVNTIHKAGYESPETRFCISPHIEIGTMRRPAIVGPEESFLEITMGWVMEDMGSQVRLPGFAFMKGGRSVGVYGPPPNLNRRWDDKRSKSKKQALKDVPMLVLINGDNVVGDPKLHRDYFERVWLTKNNDVCSAIGIVRMVTLDGTLEIDYFENSSAAIPMPKGFYAEARGA